MALSLARARAPRRSLASALRQLPFHAAEGARAPQTPLVVVDGATLVTNLSLMQERANLLGVRLRPHVKTHKSLAVAHMQLGLGADGVTASKVSEAIVFIEGGVPSVSVAYPVVDVAKARELMRAARLAGAEVRLAVDSVEGVQSAVAAAEAEDVRGVRLLLEIDVGLHRCGVDARRRGAVEQFVEAALPALGNRVALTGVMSHAGHAYAAPDAATLTRIQEEETTLMTEARARLAAALRVGEEAVECSVGSTPTELLPRAGGARGITHLQPGNYVYLDLTTVGKGIVRPSRMALSVVARVVSENERYWIVDCGSKVLSSDTGAHGTASALFPGFGRAVPLLTAAHSLPDGASFARHSVGVARLSEEHGWLAKSGADAASGAPTLRVGDLVRVYPNHSCVVANLASEFWLTDIKDPRRVSRMPVDARGCTI